jgi:hypothetical protein
VIIGPIAGRRRAQAFQFVANIVFSLDFVTCAVPPAALSG